MPNITTPHQIESESFRIIRSEIGAHNFNEAELTVAVRVIHATADFDFREILHFHPRAIKSALEILRAGGSILTDVHMVEAGISRHCLDQLGGEVRCDIRHPEVIQSAKATGETRSTMAMRRNAQVIHGGIVVIGNAPTALIEVIRLVKEENIRPALIVGVPVGFVNVVESKEALMELDIPFITSIGRKGGSSVAVATINAMMRLAIEQNNLS